MGAGKKFTLWIFASIALTYLIYLSLGLGMVALPLGLVGLRIIFPILIGLGLAAAMGLFRENTRRSRAAIVFVSLILPVIFFVSLIAFGYFTNLMLGTNRQP